MFARDNRKGVMTQKVFLGMLGVVFAVAACGGENADLVEARQQVAALLEEGDASKAWAHAKRTLGLFGEDGALHLAAATACLRLERRSDAINHGTKGLAALPEGDESSDLRADLYWARGAGFMGRYRDLMQEPDWGGANVDLEKATETGNHRAEAAFLVAVLQHMGGHENDERFLRFARMVMAWAPEGREADRIAEVLKARGLELQ